MPVYNCEKYVSQSIKSVLEQTYDNFELIIIDDGSTDKSLDIIKSFNDPRINLEINKTNLGLQKTLNLGLKLSRGEYIARIDADDEWGDKNKLRLQIDYMTNHKDCAVIGTGVIVMNEFGIEKSRTLHLSSDSEIKNDILCRSNFAHGSVLIKKNRLIEAGGYSESSKYKHIEDYELWLRLGRTGSFANLNIYGLKYRVWDNQIGSLHKLDQLKKHIRLIIEYKNQYPGFLKALTLAYLRLLVYGYLKF